MLTSSIEQKFEHSYSSARLNEAMRYALAGSGKRLRPLLVLSSAVANAEPMHARQAVKFAMPAALAVEYVHTYSLIHDDLPAMDDDDYRRGRPSLHRQFDDGLAILVGDTLLADAFYWISHARLNALKQCRELAVAAGRHGLPAGQADDLAQQKIAIATDWLPINQAKTARLFEACAVLGALSMDANSAEVARYRQFGANFGRAFQLQDDVDDQAGICTTLGAAPTQALLKASLSQVQDFAPSSDESTALKQLVEMAFLGSRPI